MRFTNRKGQLTHAEVGTILGISRGRVFQLEQQALLKLRHALAGVEVTFDFHDTKEARATRQLAQEFAARVER